MNPDPRFPDRPNDPDFVAMSAVVIANDEMAVTLDFAFLLALHVDPDSGAYMARQRAMRAIRDMRLPDAMVTQLAAVWLDGLCTGVGLERRRPA